MKFIKNKQVIPGFGISVGVTLTILSLIVLIPMSSLILSTLNMGAKDFFRVVFDSRILNAYKVSFFCALIAGISNLIFGLIIAWVLVRYDFVGKKFLDSLIELPFALPTAVAGIALTNLYSDKGYIGSLLAPIGIKVSYTVIGITLAMIFVGIPFVVRTVQPVLENLDGQYEEAANVLGASRIKLFFKVILPELKPALLTGFGLSFARAIGEYGSVVFIAGNIPYKTEIAPLLIMGKLEQFDYSGATAVALVMLVFSFLTLLVINVMQSYANKFTKC